MGEVINIMAMPVWRESCQRWTAASQRQASDLPAACTPARPRRCRTGHHPLAQHRAVKQLEAVAAVQGLARSENTDLSDWRQ